jgi:hypothetical protein
VENRVSHYITVGSFSGAVGGPTFVIFLSK